MPNVLNCTGIMICLAFDAREGKWATDMFLNDEAQNSAEGPLMRAEIAARVAQALAIEVYPADLQRGFSDDALVPIRREAF